MLDFIETDFLFFASERLGKKIMKVYPKVEQRRYLTLLCPTPNPWLDAADPQCTTQRAIGIPTFAAQCLIPRGQRRIVSAYP